MATLGFKIGAASGSGATAAAAIGGGLYLNNNTSTIENETSISEEGSVTKDPSKEDLNKTPKTKPEQSQKKKTKSKYTPKWTTSSKNYSENPIVANENYSEKLGDRYSLFLASTTIDSNLEEETKNSYLAWWEEKLELLKGDITTNQDSVDAKFKEVTKEYSDDDEKALNQVCKTTFLSTESTEKTYKFDLSKSDHDPIKEEERNINTLEKNFWRYCSSLMVKPWNMVESRESSTDGGHISYADTAGYILAATKTGFNNEFWKIKNEWFLNLWENNKVETKFRNYAESKGDSAKENQKISLRKVCSTTTRLGLVQDQLSAKEVVQYCAFSERFYKSTTHGI